MQPYETISRIKLRKTTHRSRTGMANFFKWWVKYKVVDRKKVGHRCNDIDEGLELGKQEIK